MGNNTLLKKTQSLCLKCLKKIPAEIYEANSKEVYMVKKCPRHGNTKVQLESDSKVYKKLMKKKYNQIKKFRMLGIPLNNSCNMNCPHCLLGEKQGQNSPLEEITKNILSFKGKIIMITGGEATLRKDLPGIIKTCTKHNKQIILLTNGLKLANKDYLNQLFNAGLKGPVALSINTLNEKTHKKLHNDDTLKLKLKAFQNLKEFKKIPVFFSIMVAKNINYSEIPQLLDFCIKNIEIIDAIRIRSYINFGNLKRKDKVYLSELIKSVAKYLKINYLNLLGKSLKKDLPCSFNTNLYFYIHNGKTTFLTASQMRFHPLTFIFATRNYRLIKRIKLLLSTFFKKAQIKSINLGLRSWPDKNSIDFGQIKACPSQILIENNQKMPFCQSTIYNDLGMIKYW